MTTSYDDKYLTIVLNRIEICRRYRPKFGQGGKNGLSLEQFQTLYAADPFYAWFGLDNALVYAAHKAAGGITSVYRQIGTGCEELFRQILQDHLLLDRAQVSWSYKIPSTSSKERVLKLDGRIEIAEVPSQTKRQLLTNWLRQAATQLDIAPEVIGVLKGTVFEVRQGYKSKDSKRQNADIANAASAYVQGYLPVVIVFSSQIDTDVALRYEHEKWLVLRGALADSTTHSAYAFLRDVIGYDLAAFFNRHSAEIRRVVIDVLQALLSENGQ